MKELLILVDTNDREIGVSDKLSVHQKGELHRAFSVFIFNDKGELLLQQRANDKYHSPALWSNSCCSHPRLGETTLDAANRRLHEEMGMHCELKFAFSFIYNVKFDNGLIEHEFDHIYFGKSNEPPKLNEDEAQDWKYMTMEKLQQELKYQPSLYTAWLKISLPLLMDYLNKNQKNIHHDNY